MKSIRGKFLRMNLISIFLCILLIGGLGLWSISSIQTASSREILSLTCRAEGQDLDEEINSIQDSVDLFCAMTDHLLPSLEALRDQAFVDSLYAETERNMGQIAKVTHGVCAYYFRTAPELTEKPEGFFYGKRPGTDSIEKEPLTDLSIYDPSDTEHVGWYYQPQAAGRPIWMEPYYNKNLDIYMVSYVVPFFRDGVFWAIAGMDIDFDVVIESVQSIRPYKTGYAFLCSDQGKIYYHPSLEIGASLTAYCHDLQPVLELFSKETKPDVYPVFQYHFIGTGKTMAFHELDNGMKLILTVENSEIKAPLTDLFSHMTCITAVLCAAAVLAVIMISNHISQPLKTLTQAAKKIASGNLDVELPRASEDEVGVLTRSFEVTVSNLKKYIASMNNMAFTDPLTQVKNKTAYDRAAVGLQDEMDAGKAKFALVMMDLNRLKYINDRFGHDRGDEYIVACAKLICDVFKRSPVFRVGGDEFIVILVGESLAEWKALMDELNRRIENSYQEKEIWQQLSVAKGISFNEPGDKAVEDVFVRADQAMYADKKKDETGNALSGLTAWICATGKEKQMKQYETFELRFSGETLHDAWAGIDLTAVFTHGGESKTVKGFYDGEGQYVIRFLPEEPGDYSWKVSGIIRAEGKEICEPAEGQHGPVRAADTHFEYADGRLFIPFGTTVYALASQDDELVEQTLETLKSAPFNKVRMCVFPKHYDYNHNEPPFFAFEKRADGGWDTGRPCIAFWHRLEKILHRIKAMGIQIDLILFHPYDRWGFASLPQKANLEYLDYLLRRLSAMPNIWWSLANEYDLCMPVKSLKDWEEIEAFVAANDPYRHPLSSHNCFCHWDFSRENVTHCSIQTKALAEIPRWMENYHKPVVIDECAYEGNLPHPWGSISGKEMVYRFWRCYASGAYCTHGETFLSDDEILWWARGGKLKGESPRRIAFLREIMESLPGPLTPWLTEWSRLPLLSAQSIQARLAARPAPEGFTLLALNSLARMNDTERATHMQADHSWASRCGDQAFLKFFDLQTCAESSFELPQDKQYRVELIDVWEITRKTIMENVSGKTLVKLPAKEGMAVLITEI